MLEHHRILVVDDDALDRQSVIQALHREAAAVDDVKAVVLEASTIAQAREALQGEEFACIFLDHNLPDGTALDLLMEVRSRGLATPVVVLTGERDEQTIVEVMRAGAVDYLPKEKLHPDLVARSLRAALRFLHAQREKQAVLTELHARDRAIAAASNGIVIADPRQADCPLVYVNEAFLKMTGYSQEEVIGRNCRFLQGPDTDDAAVQKLRDAVQQERNCQVLVLNYRKDSSTFWNEITVSPVRDTRGIVTHFVGIQTDTTARHQADEERKQMLAEQRARAEREALLNRIGQALRATTDPELIQETAAALVGEALGVDRCYFSVYDPQKDAVRIARDWHRLDLPSVTGEYSLAEYQGYVDALYASGTAIVADALNPDVSPDVQRVLGGFGIRAFLAVPLFDEGKFTAALAASMNNGPRFWTSDEVSLMEAVLTQTRTAVEATRMAQRERRFLRDVLASVTEGKLLFCNTASDLPAPLTSFGDPIQISTTEGLRELRQATYGACQLAGLSTERSHDLVTAASEAGMNVAVHAGSGTGQVSVTAEGTVQVRVEDQGGGISMENLPRATLSRGFSTKATLGHGLKMMLETADRLYLLTGPTGTTVVLEQERDSPRPAWL